MEGSPAFSFPEGWEMNRMQGTGPVCSVSKGTHSSAHMRFFPALLLTRGSSTSESRELVADADSLAFPRPTWSESAFQQDPRLLVCTFKFVNHPQSRPWVESGTATHPAFLKVVLPQALAKSQLTGSQMDTELGASDTISHLGIPRSPQPRPLPVGSTRDSPWRAGHAVSKNPPAPKLHLLPRSDFEGKKGTHPPGCCHKAFANQRVSLFPLKTGTHVPALVPPP